MDAMTNRPQRYCDPASLVVQWEAAMMKVLDCKEFWKSTRGFDLDSFWYRGNVGPRGKIWTSLDL